MHVDTPWSMVSSDGQLAELCESLRRAEWIALDTEFVSEDTYFPELCLIQVTDGTQVSLIDPLGIADLRPFWSTVASGSHRTIVHAGREEFIFCRRAVGMRPNRLIDTQVAAGMLGPDYPASYSKLLDRYLKQRLNKGETRTDWRRRPLSTSQLEYAVEDVVHLVPLCHTIDRQLESLGRTDWLTAEMEAVQRGWESFEHQERWRRVPGISGLSRRSLGVLREVWQYREQIAQELNQPSRRVLRDDLLLELARRATPDLQKIRAIRGMQERRWQKHLEGLAQAVQSGLQVPADRMMVSEGPNLPQVNVLAQFLNIAMANLCQAQQLSPNLVSSVQDMRDWIVYRLWPPTHAHAPIPALACGWRAEVIGDALEQLLQGRAGLFVGDPQADAPLIIRTIGNSGAL